jgi:glycosyltransferase involved in cell wall biosynthesis
MPNVVLEAMACGTPVVAAPFASASEVLNAPAAGEIAAERSATGIAAAWLRLQDRAPSRAATRSQAERFGWHLVVEAQRALYARALPGRVVGVASGAEA